MGRKVSPIAFRLTTNRTWQSHWWGGKRTPQFLAEDEAIRVFIFDSVERSTVRDVEITRNRNKVRVIINTARPGILIGSKGSNIKKIEQHITKILQASAKKHKQDPAAVRLNIEIKEIKDFESHAALLADDIAQQLERRVAFRRVAKQTLSKVERNPAIKGCKIEMSGRLGGSEMGRNEKFFGKGSVPSQLMRGDIDYALAEAFTTYGTIGVKVWLYKGEKFGVTKENEPEQTDKHS
ncbi:MAG: 30S ribosomal protein S3 [Parcubacteria group bacterium GW2011_GWA2_47_8]|nr:MAG: 30S ribosomal protein S3 [Parcubacteria group bacterium GW2011_GWA2_47_8]